MKIVLIITLTCCCICVQAQKKIAFGFRGGVTLSNFYHHHVDGDLPVFSFEVSPSPMPPGSPSGIPRSFYYESDFADDLRTGFFSYLSITVPIKNKIALEAALGYAQKGIDMRYGFRSVTTTSNNSIEEIDYQINRNIRLDYLSIP